MNWEAIATRYEIRFYDLRDRELGPMSSGGDHIVFPVITPEVTPFEETAKLGKPLFLNDPERLRIGIVDKVVITDTMNLSETVYWLAKDKTLQSITRFVSPERLMA